MAAVSTRNIIKKFGEVPAVNGISLTVPDGEFMVLLGPSGCGKTTFLSKTELEVEQMKKNVSLIAAGLDLLIGRGGLRARQLPVSVTTQWSWSPYFFSRAKVHRR